jgi:hypothetical protein
VQNLFLYTRFCFYLLLIVALVFKSFKGHLREEIFILVFATCALVTDFLDLKVFTSNLELYAIFNAIKTLLVLGLCSNLIPKKRWLSAPMVLIGSYTLFIFLSNFSLFEVLSGKQMYSDAIYAETINSDSFQTSAKTYFALFGFNVLYSVPFLWYLLGRVLIDTDSYNPVAEIVIPTSFVLSYSLLSASVLWKK